ncbi:MAG: hypothetical protein WC761_02035 [Candidatus Paceibacterota bacterium]|jgi:hypothetical protein
MSAYRDDPTGNALQKIRSDADELTKHVIAVDQRVTHLERRMWFAPIANFFKWLVYIPKRTVEWVINDMGPPFAIIGIMMLVAWAAFSFRECSSDNARLMTQQCTNACAGLHQTYVSFRSTGAADDSDADFCSCSDGTVINVYDMESGELKQR